LIDIVILRSRRDPLPHAHFTDFTPIEFEDFSIAPLLPVWCGSGLAVPANGNNPAVLQQDGKLHDPRVAAPEVEVVGDDL